MQLSVQISPFYNSYFVKNWKYLAEVVFFLSCVILYLSVNWIPLFIFTH